MVVVDPINDRSGFGCVIGGVVAIFVKGFKVLAKLLSPSNDANALDTPVGCSCGSGVPSCGDGSICGI